jgi:starch synthase (maltosyl-transferring)
VKEGSLAKLVDRLGVRARRKGRGKATYRVPGRWVEPEAPSPKEVDVSPEVFWYETARRVLRGAESRLEGGEEGAWTRRAVVYNMLIRATAAFDHDQDGRVLSLNRAGYRETGTFMKALALLPYIRSLGCNVVHLLPICALGTDGRKGELGSPYAVRDPYRLDETLAEPAVGLGPEAEFRAFVEASHRLGIRVVVEFVFRTAAKDCAWAGEHPEWFYWIDECIPDRAPGALSEDTYGNPLFPARELDVIRRTVERGDLSSLPPPHARYRAMFAPPPPRTTVKLVGSHWAGTSSGIQVRIPGAFADWPPDDTQPPWYDVTYLRLYDHPDFNYIAYNTVRIYDSHLATPEHAVGALWDRIAGILPHHQRLFGIDGAMIDMGHALPRELKNRIIAEARREAPSFAFWDEDFAVQLESRTEGYNAAMGGYWWAVHRPQAFREAFLPEVARGMPLPFFAGPESHNTPRCAAREGGKARSALAWILGIFLPALPFIHSGFELGETAPVNTGLDFAPGELTRYPAERLPLFSPVALSWPREDLVDLIRRTLSVRSANEALVLDSSSESFRLLTASAETVAAYARVREGVAALVLGNLSPTETMADVGAIPLAEGRHRDPIGGREVEVRSGAVSLHLSPWEAVLLIGPDAPP